MVTILVTGCAGFIGSHVCSLLISKGYEVIGVDNFDPVYNRRIREKILAPFLLHPYVSFYEIDMWILLLPISAKQQAFSIINRLQTWQPV